MAFNKQANALNFDSELATDQVIFTKSDTVVWSAAQTYTYNTGLNDFCLPLAQFSLDGTIWYNQGTLDESLIYAFSTPTVSDDGIISVPQDLASSPQSLRIRLMCLAYPNQKPFNQATTGSNISYQSGYNYRKIAASGTITPNITANQEDSLVMDIPHGLGYFPNYTIFARFRSANTFITTVLSPNSRRRTYIDKDKLHFDNFMPNPFIQLQAFQYFYFIYYD